MVGLAACRKPESPPIGAAKNTLADSADQILFNARFTITDKGLRRADVEGDTAYFFHDNTLLVMRPFRGKFFSSNGALDGIAQARQGVYDTRLAKLEATGDVVMNSLDGKRLETPFARYDQRLDLISSDSTFYMSEPGRDIRGKGFRTDAGMNSFTVTTLLSSKPGKVAIP
jgi:LPS export ABC transporter protein LptC